MKKHGPPSVTSDQYAKKVKSSLVAFLVVGVTLSGVVGAFHAQLIYSECISIPSRPITDCPPLDVLIIFRSGFYIVVFLAVAAPLALLTYVVLRPPKKA